jgi:hypothetical protein
MRLMVVMINRLRVPGAIAESFQLSRFPGLLHFYSLVT